jgi:hypothetical protein
MGMYVSVSTTTFKSSEGKVEVGRCSAIHTHESVWEEEEVRDNYLAMMMKIQATVNKNYLLAHLDCYLYQ